MTEPSKVLRVYLSRDMIGEAVSTVSLEEMATLYFDSIEKVPSQWKQMTTKPSLHEDMVELKLPVSISVDYGSSAVWLRWKWNGAHASENDHDVAMAIRPDEILALAGLNFLPELKLRELVKVITSEEKITPVKTE